MTGDATIARLRSGGRIWALGAQLGDDAALDVLAHALLQRWQAGDKLVVLGNMLGPNGDPARTLDGLLMLRRRLLAGGRAAPATSSSCAAPRRRCGTRRSACSSP